MASVPFQETPTEKAQRNNVILPLVQPSRTKAFRMEIDEFIGDNAMTNLFLLALSEMQQNSLSKDGKTNWWSFYSLGGVHGMPREEWAGLEQTNNRGWCHHGQDTFPTWHRPYMYQFEQAVYNGMVQVARRYKDSEWKKTYLAACDRFRLPYWDVCMPRNSTPDGALPKIRTAPGKIWRWGFPKIFRAKMVHVRRWDNPDKLVEIENPLYQFRFPKDDEFDALEGQESRKRIDWQNASLGWFREGFDRNRRPIWKYDAKRYRTDYTVRTPSAASKGESDYTELEASVQSQTQVMATNIWHMLNPEEISFNKKTMSMEKVNQLKNWQHFANHSANDDEWSTQSLESWHDNIHVLVGSGKGMAGAMSDPAVAAFEPVFWMHHNNIDRLLAIFQALYEDKYLAAGKFDSIRPNLRDGDNLLADDELKPFRKAAGKDDCFTSSDVRDWTKTGFAVPGDRKLDRDGKDQIALYLRDTYYWATDAAEPPKTLDWPKDLSHVEALTGRSESAATAPRIQIKAMSLQAGAPTLVARAVPITFDAIVQEKPIDIKVGELALEKTAEALPDGALIDLAEKSKPTKMRTWNANIKVKKYAYDGSFSVHFFIGDVNDDTPEKFMTRLNEVGFAGIFASSSRSDCASCKQNRDRDLIYEDVVPLTSKLLDYLDSNQETGDLITSGEKRSISSLEVEEVVPFLKEHLQWRLVDPAGVMLGDVEQSGLEVKVTDRLFEPPNGDNLLGTYGPSEVHAEITQGKVGGFNG